MRGLLPDPILRLSCTRSLAGHGIPTARGWIDRLGASPYLGERLDVYSEGPTVDLLESRVAALLGKEKAVFFHKGVVAQQAALLVHAARSGRRVVALHPECHIAADEQDAAERLAGLPLRRIGPRNRPFTVADLAKVHEPLAAVSVEIPLRNPGFLLPDWDDLAAVADWCRRSGVPLHMDGARIWEVQPFYGRPLAEIAGLADTVYVSLYKGLGGIGGSLLAGPADLMEEAKVWRARFGGNLFTAFPFVVSGLDGLDRHLPRMPDYYRHAVAIADACRHIDGLTILPDPPRCNSFQVRFAAPLALMERAAVERSRDTRVWLFGRFLEVDLPDMCVGELVVGEATLGWTADEVAAALADLMERARRLRG